MGSALPGHPCGVAAVPDGRAGRDSRAAPSTACSACAAPFARLAFPWAPDDGQVHGVMRSASVAFHFEVAIRVPSSGDGCAGPTITFHANIPRLAGGHIRNPAWMVAPNRRSFEIEPMSYCCAAALVNGARCRVPARQERKHLVKTGAAASVRHLPAVWALKHDRFTLKHIRRWRSNWRTA
jgi:hypothetical protein